MNGGICYCLANQDCSLVSLPPIFTPPFRLWPEKGFAVYTGAAGLCIKCLYPPAGVADLSHAWVWEVALDIIEKFLGKVWGVSRSHKYKPAWHISSDSLILERKCLKQATSNCYHLSGEASSVPMSAKTKASWSSSGPGKSSAALLSFIFHAVFLELIHHVCNAPLLMGEGKHKALNMLCTTRSTVAKSLGL